MPMERDRYPANWDEIALALKEAAGWTCQECERPCRKPGVDWIDFVLELLSAGGPDGWYDETGSYSEVTDTWDEHPQRFTLTVAHLDQNPSNNDPSNLKALCAPCHLRHDAPFRLSNHTAKMERHGQLTIPFSEDL